MTNPIMTIQIMKNENDKNSFCTFSKEFFRQNDPEAFKRIEASEAQQAAIMAVDIWKMNPTPEQEAVMIKALCRWIEIQHSNQQQG